MATEKISIPVRARTRIAFGDSLSHRTDVGCWFMAAAAVTGGTVLLADWPEHVPDSALLFSDTLADMGAYVVHSPDGLSITTRATSGDLRGVHVNAHRAGSVLPLLFVLASVALSPCVFEGVDDAVDVVDLLRAAGADIVIDGSRAVVSPSPMHGVQWSSGSSVGTMAGLVLSLIVDDVNVDVGQLGSDSKGALSEWNRILHADEHLLPGSRRLPHDFLR